MSNRKLNFYKNAKQNLMDIDFLGKLRKIVDKKGLKFQQTGIDYGKLSKLKLLRKYLFLV